MERIGATGRASNLVLLVYAFAGAGAAAISWDAQPTENLVGKDTPVTIFNFSAPVERHFSEEELRKCEDQLGRWDGSGGKPLFPPQNYDILQILMELGGKPGEVNASWTNADAPDVPMTPTTPTSVNENRPFKDAPRRNWLYEYNATDYKSYIRLEHGVKRRRGTPKEFVDVRGTLVWTPAPTDFCGKMRLAFYRLDATGFHSEVRHSQLQFRNHSKMLAIRHAPVCFKAGGQQNCF